MILECRDENASFVCYQCLKTKPEEGKYGYCVMHHGKYWRVCLECNDLLPGGERFLDREKWGETT